MVPRAAVLLIVVWPSMASCQASNPLAAHIEEAAARASHLRGRPAPDFALVDDQHRPVRLGDFAGRWLVLYFYPQDDTPGCRCQAEEFSALLERFTTLNAAIVGVSTDPPDVHLRFRQQRGLRIVLLSDLQRIAMRNYGAWLPLPGGEPDMGRVVRTTFIIDPVGSIAWHWPEVLPEGHAQRVQSQLLRLKAEYPHR